MAIPFAIKTANSEQGSSNYPKGVFDSRGLLAEQELSRVSTDH
ncbi:hypothetical protein AB4480_00680 [Vibrio sp. 10N.261.45.A4]